MNLSLNVVIVEDEPEAANVLKSYFSKMSSEEKIDFNISVFSDGESFLKEYKPGYDIVLMDIELPGLNGMETTKVLRTKDQNVVVIFVTNLAQYAVEGYSVGALDFIVKPVNYFNFEMKMKRAISRSTSQKNVKLWISLKGGEKRCISSNSIKYIEVMNHSLTFHTTSGDFETTGSIANIFTELKNLPFAMCNRCFLVNLRFVQSTSDYNVLVGDTNLQISHLKRKEFLQKLNRFFSGK